MNRVLPPGVSDQSSRGGVLLVARPLVYRPPDARFEDSGEKSQRRAGLSEPSGQAIVTSSADDAPAYRRTEQAKPA